MVSWHSDRIVRLPCLFLTEIISISFDVEEIKIGFNFLSLLAYLFIFYAVMVPIMTWHIWQIENLFENATIQVSIETKVPVTGL